MPIRCNAIRGIANLNERLCACRNFLESAGDACKNPRIIGQLNNVDVILLNDHWPLLY